MKSTRIHFDKVGERQVDTSFIEPWGYYETAIRNPRTKNWEIQSQSQQPIEAQTAHAEAVRLCENLMHYEER